MRSKFKLILAALSCFFYWIWRSSMSSTRRVISANIRSKSLEGYVSIKNTSLKLHWHESIHNTWSNKHCAAKQEQCCARGCWAWDTQLSLSVSLLAHRVATESISKMPLLDPRFKKLSVWNTTKSAIPTNLFQSYCPVQSWVQDWIGVYFLHNIVV